MVSMPSRLNLSKDLLRAVRSEGLSVQLAFVGPSLFLEFSLYRSVQKKKKKKEEERDWACGALGGASEPQAAGAAA